MSEENAKPEGAPAPKAPSAWPPLIAVIVLMPAISWATANFLVLPKLRGAMAEQTTLAHAATAAAGAKHEAAPAGHEKPGAKGKGKEGEASGKFSYDFQNVVVNLAGAMGTRYLKTSFTVFSANAELKKVIEENKNQLLDTTITVLSSRSMADLENNGAKNVVRNDLIANFNQALNSDLVDQLYFTEFVVQ